MTPAEGRTGDPVAGYLAMFVTLGLSASLLGPALSGLRERTGTSTSAISILFVCGSLGYLAGSLLGGRGYDRRLGHRLLGGALASTAAALVAVAWAPSLAALVVAYTFHGVAGGGVDVGGNTLLVWAKGRGAGPYLNALHLCFGIGALLAPLVVNRALAWGDGVGGAYVATALPTLGIAAWLARRPAPEPVDAGAHDSGGSAPPAVLGCVATFFFLYVGVEVGFGGWVYTYAQEIDLGGRNGPAVLTALFWGSFTAGRVLSVWLSGRLAAGAVLTGSCVLAVVASGLLVVADGAAAAVWVGTVLFGFGTAPQFATMITFAERHFPLTGSATSWFMGAAGLGGLALPWIIGQLLDRSGAAAMPRAVLVAAVLTLAWLGLVRMVLTRRAAAGGRVEGALG